MSFIFLDKRGGILPCYIYGCMGRGGEASIESVEGVEVVEEGVDGHDSGIIVCRRPAQFESDSLPRIHTFNLHTDACTDNSPAGNCSVVRVRMCSLGGAWIAAAPTAGISRSTYRSLYMYYHRVLSLALIRLVIQATIAKDV